VQFADGWGIDPGVNTQPALVLRFEARSADKLMEYRAMIENKLKEFELQ
jgi:phosphomannomutase/phosphoglucomutase